MNKEMTKQLLCSLPDFFPDASPTASSVFAVTCIRKEEEWDEEQQENVQGALLEEIEDKLCVLSKRISMDKLSELRQNSVYEEDVIYYRTPIGHVGSITAVEWEVVYALDQLVEVSNIVIDRRVDYLTDILYDCLIEHQYALDTVFLSIHQWEPKRFTDRKAYNVSVKDLITSLLTSPTHEDVK